MNKWSYVSTGNFRQPLRWSLELGNPSPNAVILIWQALSFQLEGNCWFTTHQRGGKRPLLKTRSPWAANTCLFQTCANTGLFPLSRPYCIMYFKCHAGEETHLSQRLHDGCLLTVVLGEQGNDGERLVPLASIYSHFCHVMGWPQQR